MQHDKSTKVRTIHQTIMILGVTFITFGLIFIIIHKLELEDEPAHDYPAQSVELARRHWAHSLGLAHSHILHSRSGLRDEDAVDSVETADLLYSESSKRLAFKEGEQDGGETSDDDNV
eukprot:scaffold3290_cov165-Ochromonas_danica.AAC.58